MKTLPSSLASHLTQPVTTLATCWKLSRTDGVILGFTDHDKDIVYDGITYHAESGFSASAVQSTSDLRIDNLAIEGALSNDAITPNDITAGRYDHADIEVFALNHTSPSDGRILLKKGTLGDMRYDDGRFIVEINGITQPLSQTIGEVFSPACRASFGDSRCGISIASHQVTGSITHVTSRHVVRDSSRTEASHVFTYGVITFTSGENSGLSMEVKTFANGECALMMAMPYTIAIGDTYTLTQGCDKTATTCANRFNNIINFRGEPHLPGMDRLLETSATRSRES